MNKNNEENLTMMLKKIVALVLLTGMSSPSYSATDAKERTLKSQTAAKKILSKRQVIEGRKNPELIPQRAVISHFLSVIRNWGAIKTQSILLDKMNIDAVKSDWLFTLASEVQDDQNNLQFEMSVCDFIKSKSQGGKTVSDLEMVGYYNDLTNKSRQIVLNAHKEIKEQLTPQEYQQFQHYLKTEFVPTMSYIGTQPSDMLNVYDKPLVERHTECNSSH